MRPRCLRFRSYQRSPRLEIRIVRGRLDSHTGADPIGWQLGGRRGPLLGRIGTGRPGGPPPGLGGPPPPPPPEPEPDTGPENEALRERRGVEVPDEDAGAETRTPEPRPELGDDEVPEPRVELGGSRLILPDNEWRREGGSPPVDDRSEEEDDDGLAACSSRG